MGVSPLRSVAIGCSRWWRRSGQCVCMLLKIAAALTRYESPPWRAGERHIRPTTSHESVWNVWRSLVWYRRTFGSALDCPRSRTWPKSSPDLFWGRGAPVFNHCVMRWNYCVSCVTAKRKERERLKKRLEKRLEKVLIYDHCAVYG